jgi:hypothetical protein
MDMQTNRTWSDRPATVVAGGLALLAVCAVFAYLWFTSDFLLARPLGLFTGSVGLYFTYTGVIGLREQRSDG